MPIYNYQCLDCQADLEILHPIGESPQRCGIDCQRRGGGSFGSGNIRPYLNAPNLKLSRTTNSELKSQRRDAASPLLEAQAMRAEALRRMGGDITERELDKLRDAGMTVYRKSGDQHWEKDGGAQEAPAEIKPKDKESGCE
ncbi:MAG: hypothetical protein CMP23_02280 [Rickettsiales bacterium]|nr:hypothetical protein [Rickettsiales bacterium]|tara:strand:+ start:749 stop:1171 length:423 start_codon:yes stop_codon:yes gene_type:complete